MLQWKTLRAPLAAFAALVVIALGGIAGPSNAVADDTVAAPVLTVTALDTSTATILDTATIDTAVGSSETILTDSSGDTLATVEVSGTKMTVTGDGFTWDANFADGWTWDEASLDVGSYTTLNITW